jgi:hypothetical protein
MDVPGAYLNTSLPEEERIPMILGVEEAKIVFKLKPEWAKYVRRDGSLAVILKGGLYGMPQAAKLWHDLMAETLTSLGYTRCESDGCMFVKFDDSGRISVILLYVDDLAHFFVDDAFQSSLLKELSTKFGKMSVEGGDQGIYIGIEYDYNRRDKSVKLSMTKYVSKLMKDFNVQSASAMPTAADFMEFQDDLPRTDSKVFASGVMSLYYLALRTRKDILFPITVLSTRIQCCNQRDVDKLVKLYKYVYGTQDHHVVLKCSGTTLVFSVDASYAIHQNGRSHTGFCVSLSDGKNISYGGPIHCKSVVQKLVTLSSFEAELNAVHQNVGYYYFFRHMLSELGFDQTYPSVLFQDNQATMHVINNGPSSQSRSRHMNVRVGNLNQLVSWGVISVQYQSTDLMIADVLTKRFSSRACLPALKRLLNF